MTDELVEQVARVLCRHRGHDPDDLEPGSVIIHPGDDLTTWTDANGVFLDSLADTGVRPPDGYNQKGEPCHFMWRQCIEPAQLVARAVIPLIYNKAIEDAAADLATWFPPGTEGHSSYGAIASVRALAKP